MILKILLSFFVATELMPADVVEGFDALVDRFMPTIEGVQGPEKRAALKRFLGEPAIMGHIQRRADAVVFDDNGPIGCSEQEVWLYKALQGADCWTYRGCIGNAPLTAQEKACMMQRDGGFYEAGTKQSDLLLRIAGNAHVRIMADNPQLGNGHYDVYQTRSAIDVYDLQGFVAGKEGKTYAVDKPLGTRVWVTPNHKDSHATMFVHVLDATQSHVLVSIFVNSFNEDGYFQYIQGRFTLPV